MDNIAVAVRLRPQPISVVKKKTHFTSNIFCYCLNDNSPPFLIQGEGVRMDYSGAANQTSEGLYYSAKPPFNEVLLL